MLKFLNFAKIRTDSKYAPICFLLFCSGRNAFGALTRASSKSGKIFNHSCSFWYSIIFIFVIISYTLIRWGILLLRPCLTPYFVPFWERRRPIFVSPQIILVDILYPQLLQWNLKRALYAPHNRTRKPNLSS